MGKGVEAMKKVWLKRGRHSKKERKRKVLSKKMENENG